MLYQSWIVGGIGGKLNLWPWLQRTIQHKYATNKHYSGKDGVHRGTVTRIQWRKKRLRPKHTQISWFSKWIWHYKGVRLWKSISPDCLAAGIKVRLTYLLRNIWNHWALSYTKSKTVTKKQIHTGRSNQKSSEQWLSFCILWWNKDLPRWHCVWMLWGHFWLQVLHYLQRVTKNCIHTIQYQGNQCVGDVSPNSYYSSLSI